MNEEKKYSIVGKVEIGTDEYRDLIEAVKENEKAYNDANSARFKEYMRANEAEKQRDIFKKENEKYVAFVNSSEEIKAKYSAFLLEQQLKELNKLEVKND
jgi:hypothetical protein